MKLKNNVCVLLVTTRAGKPAEMPTAAVTMNLYQLIIKQQEVSELQQIM